MSAWMFFKPQPDFARFIVLALAARQPHISQREIAEAARITVGAVNRIVRDMIDDGLIWAEGENHKCRQYFLTDEGRAQLGAMERAYGAHVVGEWDTLRAHLTAAFRRLAATDISRVVLVGSRSECELATLAAVEAGLKVTAALLVKVGRDGDAEWVTDFVERWMSRLADRVRAIKPRSLGEIEADAMVVAAFATADAVAALAAPLAAEIDLPLAHL